MHGICPVINCESIIVVMQAGCTLVNPPGNRASGFGGIVSSGNEDATTDYIHLVTEAMKLALADRDEYKGDPEFVV